MSGPEVGKRPTVKRLVLYRGTGGGDRAEVEISSGVCVCVM
jgi:hypothetical protein